jgi:cell division protein ZipA
VQDLINTLTSDLRLSLLVLGATVIAILILWELVQRWRARKADAEHDSGPDDVEDVLIGERSGQSSGQRDVLDKLDSGAGGSRSAESEMDLPGLSARDDFDDRWASALSPESSRTEVPQTEAGQTEARQTEARQTDETRDEEDLPDEGVLGAAREVSAGAESAIPSVSTPPPDEIAPRVRIEWPPEDQRRVVGLRVVGKGGERFTGASLRQALQGEGFVHGEMDIFHRPVADGRVLMSAASLTQPGTFNLDTMDASLFRGLNLFAVLPGPLAGRDAVDKLLLVGHTLAQRVRGELQDSGGQALTESRLAEMRREAGLASV